MRCYSQGRRFFSQFFVVFVLHRADEQPWRLGLAVTRKTGPAVWRNRVRRLLRECVRLDQHSLGQGYDFVIVPKKNIDPRALSLAKVSEDLSPVFRRSLI